MVPDVCPPLKGEQWRTLEVDGIVSKYFRWNTQWPYGFSKTRLPIIGHTANLGLPYRNASTSSWIISTQTSIWLWNDIWVQQLQNMQTEAVITENEHQIKQVYNFTLQRISTIHCSRWNFETQTPKTCHMGLSKNMVPKKSTPSSS